MSELASRKCKPCEGGVAPYTPEQTKQMLKQVKGWIVEEGKLVKVYPEADRQKATVKVEVQIRQPNLAMIKPEMSVKANFLEKAAVSEEAARIVIPTKAVVREGNDDYYVWTVNRGMAKRVSVLRGSQTESGVEVREGLRDGDVIVVASPASLSEGQKVQATR